MGNAASSPSEWSIYWERISIFLIRSAKNSHADLFIVIVTKPKNFTTYLLFCGAFFFVISIS